ncbi:uncharacterized protein HKW66_Vig0102510 [Vigna angularis]|uniref:Uncharacterized protein n=1 Tax=Phaseolus angularis TaxID=3914 RepID=A0A8T0KPR4_PHAAN|nr:uncharacterized protein HKW66_Vig0102510 [Vigna angularis]
MEVREIGKKEGSVLLGGELGATSAWRGRLWGAAMHFPNSILFEKESPDVVGIGVAERRGLGLLENGDTYLELTPDGVSTGLGVVRFNNNLVDAIPQQKFNALH